jgi:hypothetical protein
MRGLYRLALTRLLLSARCLIRLQCSQPFLQPIIVVVDTDQLLSHVSNLLL